MDKYRHRSQLTSHCDHITTEIGKFAELPEEILAQIASYIDIIPHSTAKFRYEPTWNLFSESTCLKALSLVSRQTRRVVKPLLFKHICLDLSSEFGELLRPKVFLAASGSGGDLQIEKGVRLIREKHGALVDFLREEQFHVVVSSLLVKIGTAHRSSQIYAKQSIEDLVLPEMGKMWQSIFSVVEIPRVVLFGPLSVLGWLAGCRNVHYELIGDWHHDPQILELDRNAPPVDTTTPKDADYGLSTKAHGMCQIVPSSVLHIRRWTHIGYNEGSFLFGYNTESWLKQGVFPHPTPSLINYLFPECCAQTMTFHEHRLLYKTSAMSFVDSFAYTAIFPHHGHLSSDRMRRGINRFHYVRKLDLQVAPHPEQLQEMCYNSARIRRADLDECWGNVHYTYLDLRDLMQQQRRVDDWRLKTLVCQDHAIPSFREVLKSKAVPNNDSNNAVGPVTWGKTWQIVESEDERMIVVI